MKCRSFFPATILMIMISILSSCGGGSNAIDRTFEAAVIMEEGEIIDIAEPTKVKISGNYSSVSFKFHRHIENADVNVKGLKKIADNETLKKYLPMMSNFSETDYDMSVTGKHDISLVGTDKVVPCLKSTIKNYQYNDPQHLTYYATVNPIDRKSVV